MKALQRLFSLPEAQDFSGRLEKALVLERTCPEKPFLLFFYIEGLGYKFISKVYGVLGIYGIMGRVVQEEVVGMSL